MPPSDRFKVHIMIHFGWKFYWNTWNFSKEKKLIRAHGSITDCIVSCESGRKRQEHQTIMIIIVTSWWMLYELTFRSVIHSMYWCGVQRVKLDFIVFDTEANDDIVCLYDGMFGDNNKTRIMCVSGSSSSRPPLKGFVTQNMPGYMSVEFITDSYSVYKGFVANYTTTNQGKY
jgi:hypothetical protein